MKASKVAKCKNLVNSYSLSIDCDSLDNLKRTNVSFDTFTKVLNDLVSQRGQLEFYPNKIKIGIYFSSVTMMSLSQSGTAYGISRRLA